MARLSGKTALVTGAARGIGAAIATAFANEGALVVVTDIDRIGGHAVTDAIGGTFSWLDVTSEADWSTIAEQFPTMDIVVNNAGVTGFEGSVPPAHDPENARLADWRAVHAVNLDGTFLGCRWPAPIGWSGFSLSALRVLALQLGWPAKRLRMAKPATGWPRELAGDTPVMSAGAWCCNGGASSR